MTIAVRQFSVGFGATLQRAVNDKIAIRLERRLGRLHARQRLRIEADHEAHIFGQNINFFHIADWYSIRSLIRTTFELSGLYWWAQRNAERVQAGAGSSFVAALLNCLPEITLHYLQSC